MNIKLFLIFFIIVILQYYNLDDYGSYFKMLISFALVIFFGFYLVDLYLDFLRNNRRYHNEFYEGTDYTSRRGEVSKKFSKFFTMLFYVSILLSIIGLFFYYTDYDSDFNFFNFLNPSTIILIIPGFIMILGLIYNIYINLKQYSRYGGKVPFKLAGQKPYDMYTEEEIKQYNDKHHQLPESIHEQRERYSTHKNMPDDQKSSLGYHLRTRGEADKWRRGIEDDEHDLTYSKQYRGHNLGKEGDVNAQGDDEDLRSLHQYTEKLVEDQELKHKHKTVVDKVMGLFAYSNKRVGYDSVYDSAARKFLAPIEKKRAQQRYNEQFGPSRSPSPGRPDN